MYKLAKYLKPFVSSILIAIVLLFVQAMTDLALPDYMSNIVNKGIQQGGIEDAVPKAIRKDEMEKLTIFMSEKDKKKVLNQYTLIDKKDSDYEKYVEEYPILKKEDIYVLKDNDKLKVEELNLIMGKSFLAVSGVDKMKKEAKNGLIDIGGKKVPASTDLFMLFKNLPEEQRLKINNDMNKKFAALGDNMVIQAAANSVKAEYKTLGVDTDKIQSRYIGNTGIKMLLISLLSAVCIVMVGFFASRIAAGLARNLRKDVFKKVESFSNAELDKFSTASLITRTTNDINQIQMLIVIMIRMIFYAPIVGVGGIIKAISKSTSMSWIIAVTVIVLLGLMLIVFSIALPKFKIVQKLVDRLNLVTRENLSGMMVIRAFNTQKFEEKRFDKANKDLTRTNLFVNRIMAVMFPSMMLIMNGITLLIVWVGAHHIAESSMQVGDMMAFMQYAMQIIFAFLMMSFMFIMIPRASVSAQRISEVLEVEPTILDPEKSKSFNEELRGVVEFKNVSFKYPGAEENMLKDISFKAMPGETTAFIGATGSGKTTLINLILRFYDATEGKVLIDGVNVKEVNQYELREKIGYVPQKSSLFSGDIESNLRYANENASKEELDRAIEIAQAKGFVEEKGQGLSLEISQGGTNVSGGQKQRLSIARAIVKNPEISIFDDSFSALDFKTDLELRKALKEKTGESTVMIVAQRIATIKNAEKIIVLDEGRIVGMGTHKELMENCETYKEIALSQLSKEELA
ncbi:ABC transporter transmembrane domain-containing protein [Clostridium sp. KNHs214]|uniref:ABC transporter transmembrane domain-containing protein n=1 Tax=Clostridium sp. KNHs214 TaxID=1540257 RepID=UPI000556F63C|nr:ABC transporter transmembrane domain-containing protein [Clostridium sp. KNHs214]